MELAVRQDGGKKGGGRLEFCRPGTKVGKVFPGAGLVAARRRVKF